MLILKISLEVQGKKLNREAIINSINQKISYDKEIEDWLIITHPNIYGVEYKLELYQNWYVDLISNYYEIFKQYGATNTNLFLDVFYSNQCTFEIMSKTLMKKLGKFELSYPISVYKIDDSKIKKALIKSGRSKEDIDKIYENE